MKDERRKMKEDQRREEKRKTQRKEDAARKGFCTLPKVSKT